MALSSKLKLSRGINGGNSLEIKFPLSFEIDEYLKITITSEDGTSKVMKKRILKPKKFTRLFNKGILISFGLPFTDDLGDILEDLSKVEKLYGTLVFNDSLEECTLTRM